MLLSNIVKLVNSQLAGEQLTYKNVIPHLDFALVCLFAILAYEQFQSIKRYFPIGIAVIALVIASFFTSNWLLLVAITICMLMILARGVWVQRSVQGGSNEQ